jgi:hypothetical protein
MGMFPKKNCSSSPYVARADACVSTEQYGSAPNPEVFTIIQERYFNGYLILKVEYPHCTNFEGLKIMIYKNGFKTSEELLKFNNGELDPHFSRDIGSPIARFRPTAEAEELIIKLIS